MLRTYLPNLEKLPEQAEALVGAQGFPLKISFIFSKCPTPPPPRLTSPRQVPRWLPRIGMLG